MCHMFREQVTLIWNAPRARGTMLLLVKWHIMLNLLTKNLTERL